MTDTPQKRGSKRLSAAADSALAAALRSRHADTLRGALAPVDAAGLADVEVSINPVDMSTLAGQHLSLHTANLLGRLEGVVSTVSFTVDGAALAAGTVADVPLFAGVDPCHPEGSPSFAAALKGVVTLAAPHRVAASALQESNPSRVRVHIGGVEDSTKLGARANVYAACGDWVAHVGREPGPGCDPEATLSFGAHAAAALAVGEVFRILRARGAVSAGPGRMTLSVWSCKLLAPGTDDGPSGVTREWAPAAGVPAFTLVGVGAVGSAFLLTLWASGLAVPDAVLVDGDVVSRTNLNRYPLFGLENVESPKASGAATLLRRMGTADQSPFNIRGADVWWAEHRRTSSDAISLLISAVDTNAARHQLQDALPGVVLGASTHELRAEIDRYEMANMESRCLKCHNPPEIGETDAVLRARLLTFDVHELAAEAEDRGVDSGTLQRYVDDLRNGGTGCAVLAGPSLERLRRTAGEGAFAVSFVSALAGTMLAAQLAREGSIYGPALLGSTARAHVQMWRPAASVNGIRATAPEPRCWCSQPSVRFAYAALNIPGAAAKR